MFIRNLYINNKNFNSEYDSMCYDSGTIMASCDIDDFKVSIEVVGEVNVEYKGETYRHASDFPRELLNAFKDDLSAQAIFLGLADDIYIHQNNWYEVFIYDDEGNWCDSYVEDYLPDWTLEGVKDYFVSVIEDYYDYLDREGQIL